MPVVPQFCLPMRILDPSGCYLAGKYVCSVRLVCARIPRACSMPGRSTSQEKEQYIGFVTIFGKDCMCVFFMHDKHFSMVLVCQFQPHLSINALFALTVTFGCPGNDEIHGILPVISAMLIHVEMGLAYRWLNLPSALVYLTKISPSHSVQLGKILSQHF